VLFGDDCLGAHVSVAARSGVSLAVFQSRFVVCRLESKIVLNSARKNAGVNTLPYGRAHTLADALLYSLYACVLRAAST
jgi:hypothetical protein